MYCLIQEIYPAWCVVIFSVPQCMVNYADFIIGKNASKKHVGMRLAVFSETNLQILQLIKCNIFSVTSFIPHSSLKKRTHNLTNKLNYLTSNCRSSKTNPCPPLEKSIHVWQSWMALLSVKLVYAMEKGAIGIL